MEEADSTYLLPKLNHKDSTFGMPRKKFPRYALTNGLEKNEATLVAEATAYAARRFHTELTALQGHSKRRHTPAPPTHQSPPSVTCANTSAAVIVKPEPLRMALLEVNEEDEEMEAQNDPLDIMSNGTKLSREAFLERAKELLTRPESIMVANSTSSVSYAELKEALSTVLARNSRLQELRHSQISRYLQLQRRAESLNAELDASVDNLRHHRTRWEAEKRRLLVEEKELRQQLAEALAVVAQSSPKRSNNHHSDQGEKGNCLQCEKRNLEISALKIAIERLEGELARHRRAFEQESANFSVQLADAAAENRSLRLQLSRSSTVTTSVNSNTLPSKNSCVSCKRLQQLVDILQEKKSSRNSASEVEIQTEFPPEIPENSRPNAAEEESDGRSLFELLESRGRINDLTTEYLEQQLGECLRTAPQKLTVKTPPQTSIIMPDKNAGTTENEMSKTPDVPRLLERLKKLEAEAQSSADQLRSSNDEFLQLRERLTSATIEKAHLKARLDSSNDRILQLESDLNERIQDLQRLQSRLSDYQKPQSCVLRFEDSDHGPVNSSPQRIIIRQTYSKCQQVFASISKIPKQILNQPTVYVLSSVCRAAGNRVLKRIDYRIIGSRGPRVVVFIVLILYMCILHLLLANCLLQ
ncbi:unnamed protein product [Rodentolepis nana]|uniref:Golgin-84 n=1 Tax=Rodentolepis nana TaxID=102285 RepID=A0A158QH61_RODNA|nr:unnamed protein product [Rodentolepis nana]